MQVFTSTEFQRNPGDIFNAVQSDGQVDIKHKARPDMMLILKADKIKTELELRNNKLDIKDLTTERDSLKAKLCGVSEG